jgi:lipopolysaccharide/colanic/teichoic acid biosynthesis glycosyltransferase
VPAAVVAVPILALLVPAMLASQGRPVLYVAERMRAPGRPFRLFKLRTMRPAARNDGVSGGDKDARITPMGRWLRRFRLDELPQIANVLSGEMSVVGPRPPLRLYTDAFPELYAAVLRMPPGATGLATLIYHRHEERLLARCATAEETHAVYARACVPRKARLDRIYAERWSVGLDLWILWRTLATLLGAPPRRRRRRAL